MENKRDLSNSLKRTWVQSKGNSKVAILGVTERMNRDRRQHKLHSMCIYTIYIYTVLCIHTCMYIYTYIYYYTYKLLNQSQIPVQGDLYTVNKYSYPFFTV